MQNVLPQHVQEAFRRAPGGLLTTNELGRLHVSRPALIAMADEGLVDRVMYGVYRDPGSPIAEDQCLHLPLIYLGQRRPTGCPPELVTGEAALAVRGVPGFELPCPPLILIHETRHVRRHRHAFRCRRVGLEQVQSEVVRRVRVTREARSLADAACSLDVDDQRLRTAVDHLRNRAALDIVAAAAEWSRRVHDGHRRLDDMRMAGAFEQESEGERRAFSRVLGLLPQPPDCQVYLASNIRVDFVVLSAALVIEYHGGVHDRSVDADATRAMALRLLGYEVIVVTKSMLRDAPALLSHIQAVIAQRQQLIRDGHLRRPALPPQPPRLTALQTLHAA